MKIVYILNAFPVLTQTWVPLETRELTALGNEVEVVALGNSGAPSPTPCWQLPSGNLATRLSAFVHHVIWKIRSPIRYFKAFFFILARADRQSLALFLTAPRVASHVRKRGAQWLHSHFADQGTEMAMLVSMLTGIPFSFTPHAHDLWEHPRLLGDKMSRAAFVASISEHNRQWCLERFGMLGQSHFPLVRVGVDPARFHILTDDGPPGPEAGEPFRVLSVGRLVPKKGHDLLIQAGRLAASRDQPLEIRIAGEGPQEAELRRIADEAPGSGCVVRFLGVLSGEQVLGELASAHLFALACRRSPQGDMDGIPASLMEAMAMELPVLTTRLSGIPELVENGLHGRLVEPEDLVGLAKALTEMAAMSPGKRRTLGRAGRETVEAEFNCRRSAEVLDRQIRRRLGEPGAKSDGE